MAAVDRRGKYLIVRFESGRVLLIHLRMTGSLRHAPAGALPDDPYRRAIVKLDDGSELAYRDVRRFGTWLLLEPGELDPYLAARVGPEPLEARFRARDLGARLARRRAPVKAAILDQRTLAGVGNIYADEALWRARIHPLREAGSLEGRELRPLHRGIRKALEHGIARQGSTLRDYALPDGGSGRDAGRVQGLRPRGRAVRPLRDADRADHGRRPRDVVLPACQARTATSCPAVARPRLAEWGAPTRPRRSCSARCGSRRPTGSSTSTRASAAGSARSRRGSGRRSPASARGSSRSPTSS